MLEQGEGKYILAASQSTEEAYKLSTENHSIFTFYLIEGLKGAEGQSVDQEGNVTPETLGKYVYKKIVDLPREKKPIQRPITKVEAAGNIVLVHYPEYNRREREIILASMKGLLYNSNVEEFNRMHQQNPDVPLDLSRINLYRKHLQYANFSNANLFRANLSEADLEGSDLSNTNLFKADLEGTNLLKASLKTAILGEANLHKANLVKADLSNANLVKADLSNANLFGANLQRAVFLGADLRDANLTDVNRIETDFTGANFSIQKRAMTGPIIEPSKEPEPIIEPSKEPEPIIEPSKEPEPIIEPSKEPEPIIEPSKEPEPIIEPSKEPEPIIEPSKEPEPIIEPSKEPKWVGAPIVKRFQEHYVDAHSPAVKEKGSDLVDNSPLYKQESTSDYISRSSNTTQGMNLKILIVIIGAVVAMSVIGLAFSGLLSPRTSNDESTTSTTATSPPPQTDGTSTTSTTATSPPLNDCVTAGFNLDDCRATIYGVNFSNVPLQGRSAICNWLEKTYPQLREITKGCPSTTARYKSSTTD